MLKDISPKINEIAESIALLKHLAAGEKYADLKESLNRKYTLSLQGGLRKFALLERIEQNAENVLQNQMDEIRYYFSVNTADSTNDADISCAAIPALLWEPDMELEIENTRQLRDYLSKVSEETYCEKFGLLLHNYTEIIYFEDEKQTITAKEPYAVIQYLMKMDITDEEKWKLQRIFCDRNIHQTKILALLERAGAVLKTFWPQIEELTALFLTYWTDTLKGSDIAAFLQKNKAIDIPENPLGFHMRPSVINPNVISMQLNMDSKKPCGKPDYFKLGILFGEDLHVSTDYGEKDDAYEIYVMQALKLLSDKSKFEILSYIRDKAAYGSELARHLHLTTATVSHHMNSLLSSGLVRLKRVDNRVYYMSNKDALEELLQYCARILTGKD